MRIERRGGAAATLLEDSVPDPLPRPVVQVFAPARTTLILGSAQKDELVDWERARRGGVDVARRRSGGGAVLLVAGADIWIDILLPKSDPRWSDDVVTSTRWLGAAWARALDGLGVAAQMHRGGLERTRWGRLVCFAALGPGELVVGGRKVVGISQRRTRAGARFQSLVLQRWDPASLLDLLALTPGERAQGVADLRDVAAGPGVPTADLEAALLTELRGC